jgi:hypothetical protein
LIKVIFRDAIQRFSVTDREPLDLLDKGSSPISDGLGREAATFNPLSGFTS